MKDITLDLWNLNIKIGDVENLKKVRQKEKKNWLQGRTVTISTATLNGPNQNAINLTNIEPSDSCKSKCKSRGPSFVLSLQYQLVQFETEF